MSSLLTSLEGEDIYDGLLIAPAEAKTKGQGFFVALCKTTKNYEIFDFLGNFWYSVVTFLVYYKNYKKIKKN